jgi:glycosyltransferase involved in cell wall biosynthesis
MSSRIRVLAVADGWIPSVELVLREPLKFMEARGLVSPDIRLISEAGLSHRLRSADLLILMRVFEPEALGLAEEARTRGIPVIYAIDDDFESLDPETPLAQHYRRAGAWPRIQKICSLANQVWVFSRSLRDKLLPFQRHVVLLPAIASIELISTLAAGIKANAARKVIGYAATRDHVKDFASIAPDLLQVLGKHPEVDLEVIDVMPKGLEGHPRVRRFAKLESIREYYEFVLGRNWTVGVAPLLRNPANDAKTDNKYREYAALGVPGLYSTCPAYAGSIVDGVNGILVATGESWTEKLSKLLENDELRASIRERAQHDVRERNSLARVSHRYFDCIAAAMRNPLRVHVVAPAGIASVDIDIIRPFAVLASEGTIEWTIGPQASVDAIDLAGVEVLIIVRYTDPETCAILRKARDEYGSVVIYSYDDDFFAIPDDLGPLSYYYRHPSTVDSLRFLLSAADVVKATTPRLAARSREYSSNVVESRYGFDFEQIVGEVVPGGRPNEIVIGFFGSRSHTSNIQHILPALLQIEEEFPKVRFEFFGPGSGGLELLKRATFLEWQTPATEAVAAMMRRGWDIGLAPLVANDFNAAKLPTKYRDYGACGITGVYSKVEAYLKFVKDGETGLLVENNSEQWADAIRRLIVSPALRDHIRTMAFLDVRSNHSLEAAVETWRDVLHKARALHRVKMDGPGQSISVSVGNQEEVAGPATVVSQTRGNETMRAQATAFYAHHQRVWRYSTARLVHAVRKATVGREPREPFGAELQTLVAEHRANGIAGGRCRLRLGENLQHRPYVEYPLLPYKGTCTSAIVGMWMPLLCLGGAFGIEIVSGDERIVVNKRVDLAEVAPNGVVHLSFPPLAIADSLGWRLRVFAVDSPVPVHVYEWTPVGRGRRRQQSICLHALRND